MQRLQGSLRRVFGRLLLAMGLASALLGGCGGSGGGDSDPPPPPPPAVTTQPQAARVADGQAASFTVVASGQDLSYQWQKNAADVAGATAATLAVPAAALADSGASYRVVVSNDGGSVTSSAAILTVTPVGPTITAQPVSASLQDGGSATFSVVASGSAPLAYQWQRNGVDIAGATAASYTLNPARLADSGATFAVRVSNAAGPVTSSAATLTVLNSNANTDGTRSLWLAQTHTLALRSDGLLMGWGSNSNAQLGGGTVIAGSPAIQIATGVASASANVEFGLAIDGAGALRGWGANSSAWLGGSGSTTYTTPQTVSWPAHGVHQVEAGWLLYDTRSFTVALLSDGTVWHLPGGREIAGGVTTDSPGQVAGLYDITALARGHGAAAYAVRADGTVWRITVTQSGSSGPNWMRSRADQVAGLGNVREIACGDKHCLALLADGSLRAWGEGRSGELGHGLASSSTTPVVVSGLSHVTHVAVTSVYGSSMARTADGKVWSWGRGELSARPLVRSGAFTFPPADSAVPVEVPSLAGSTEVACSDRHCAARRSDGTVWTWGDNLYGQLGVGTLPAQEPVQVPGVQLNAAVGGAGTITPALRLLAVPRPGWAGVGQTLSLHASAVGRADISYQWLRNGASIGGATAAAYTTPPLEAGHDGVRYSVRVTDGTETITSAEASVRVQAGGASLWPGASYTLALRGDGSLLGWGNNSSRQLGSGAAVPGTPAQLVTSGIAVASAGAAYGLGIDTQGGLWGWGADSDVWLGGTTPTSGAALVPAPVAVLWPARRVRQAEAGLLPYTGARNSFMLLADGTVWQLPGDKRTSGANAVHSAVQVPGLYDITALSQGHGKAYAIGSDGSVWSIGLVLSSEPGYAIPYATAVAGLGTVRRIVCGTDHCLALLADGSLRAWGLGTRGQLGQGAASTSSAPVVVAGLSGVTHIAVTSVHGASFARTADGKVYSWGAGELSGRVLAGTTSGVPADALQPVEITALAGSTELACSAGHCVARQADGAVWAWGGNASGQLGVAGTSAAQAPVRVPGINLN